MKKILFATIFCACILSGCFPNGERDFSEISESSSSELQSFLQEKIGENVIISTDMDISNENKLESYSVSLKNFSEDEIKKILLNNEEITFLYNREGSDFYETDDESLINSGLGSLYYSEKDYTSTLYSYMISLINLTIDSGINSVFVKEESEEFTLNDAVSVADKTLQGLGVKNYEFTTTTFFDYETLTEQYKTITSNNSITVQGKEQERPFQKSDEAYMIDCICYINDFPILENGYTSTNNDGNSQYNYGTYISLIVSKNKVLDIALEGIYEIQDVAETNSGVSVNSIINKISDKFNNIILSEPITITSIDIEYVPVNKNGQIYIEPFWVIGYSQSNIVNDNKTSNQSYDTISKLYYSYYSGEELS